MALIHIEPVPPRLHAGAVMAFICNATKLEGKQIGKIAFVGRGATVEVRTRKQRLWSPRSTARPQREAGARSLRGQR